MVTTVNNQQYTATVNADGTITLTPAVAEAAEALAHERNEIFRMLGLPEGDFGLLEKYAHAKQDAEALVGELREALTYAEKEHEARGAYHLCYTPEPSAETERLKLRLEEAKHNATIYRNAAIAKTPADMSAELARLREENARLIETGDLLVASESLEVGWHEAVAAWQSAKEGGK
jgi:hypothetical protein